VGFQLQQLACCQQLNNESHSTCFYFLHCHKTRVICVKVQYSVDGVTPIRHGGSVASVPAHLDAKMALISEVPNKRKCAIVISSFLFPPLHFFILRPTCLFVTIFNFFLSHTVRTPTSRRDYIRFGSKNLQTNVYIAKKDTLKNLSYEYVNSITFLLPRLQLLMFLFVRCM
jgi:hypothetical protein